MPLTQSELSKKLTEVKDRARAVSDELSTLEAKDQLTEKEDRRLNDLTRAAANLADDEITIRKEWSDAIRDALARGELQTENGDGVREGAPRFNQTDTTRARFAGDCASLAPYSTGRTSPRRASCDAPWRPGSEIGRPTKHCSGPQRRGLCEGSAQSSSAHRCSHRPSSAEERDEQAVR